MTCATLSYQEKVGHLPGDLLGDIYLVAAVWNHLIGDIHWMTPVW